MSLMRSSAFFHAKARWYRAMAGHATGDAKAQLLVTAGEFETKARASEGRAAASTERLTAARRARRTQG